MKLYFLVLSLFLVGCALTDPSSLQLKPIEKVERMAETNLISHIYYYNISNYIIIDLEKIITNYVNANNNVMKSTTNYKAKTNSYATTN